MDVITTALILMEVIIVPVWMDMYWNQIIILVQVRRNNSYLYYVDQASIVLMEAVIILYS